VPDFRRFRGVAVVLAGVAAGLGVPGAAAAVGRLTLVLVALLVFVTLHGTRVGGRSVRSALGVVASVLGLGYVLVPVGVAGVAGAFDPRTATGLLVVAAAPTTAGSALVWSGLAGGDDLLATAGAVATLVLAPVAVPGLLAVLVDGPVAVPAWPLLRDLTVVVGGGAALARAVPSGALGPRGRSAGSLAAVFLLVYAGVGGAGAGLPLRTVAGVAAVAAGVVVVPALLVAVAVARGAVARATGVAFVAAGTLKNLGVSLAVAAALGGETAVVVVVFYVAQQVVASLLAALPAR
jgi:hypothetical protein